MDNLPITTSAHTLPAQIRHEFLNGLLMKYGGEKCRYGLCIPHYSDAIYAIAAHPTGTHLVTAGNTGLNLWQTDLWKCVRRISDEDSTFAVAFSPDGRLFVSGGIARLADGTNGRYRLRLWNVPDFDCLHLLEEDTVEVASQLVFSSDGRRVYVGSRTRLNEYAVQKKRLTLRKSVPFVEPGGVHCLAVSDDYKWIAAGRTRHVEVFSRERGRKLFSFSLPAEIPEADPVVLCFVDDGQRLAVAWKGASDKANVVTVFPLGLHIEPIFLDSNGLDVITSLTVDDEKGVLTCMDKRATVCAWSLATRSRIRQEPHSFLQASRRSKNSAITSACLLDNKQGAFLVSSCADEATTFAGIDLITGKSNRIEEFSFPSSPSSLAADDYLLLVGYGFVYAAIALCNMKTGRLTGMVPQSGCVQRVLPLPGKQGMISRTLDDSGSNSVVAIDADSKELWKVASEAKGPLASEDLLLSVSPDGLGVALAYRKHGDFNSSGEWLITMWNLHGPGMRSPSFRKTLEHVWSMAVTDGGKHLIIGGPESNVRIVSAETGICRAGRVADPSEGPIRHIVPLGNDKMLVANNSNICYVSSFDTLQVDRTARHHGFIAFASGSLLSCDEHLLLRGVDTIQCWNVATLTKSWEYLPGRRVFDACFVGEDDLVAVACQDRAVHFLWPSTGELMAKWYMPSKGGILWTAPSDEKHAPHGWFWCDDPRGLITVTRSDGKGLPEAIPEDDPKYNEIIQRYNRRDIILARLQGPAAYRAAIEKMDRVVELVSREKDATKLANQQTKSLPKPERDTHE